MEYLKGNIMHDRDFFELEEEFERPRKDRKQRNNKAADKYYSDDGYEVIKNETFKKRRQAHK